MRQRRDWDRDEVKRTTTLHDSEAERALLGGLLIDPNRLIDVEGKLEAEDLYDPIHQKILRAMLAIEERSAIDTITIKAQLNRDGLFDAATAERLRVIEESTLSAANLLPYLEIIRDKALRRKLSLVAERIGGLAVEAGTEAAALSDEAERLVFELSDEGRSGEPKRLRELLPPALVMLKEMQGSKGEVTGMSTGIFELDRRTTGFHPGELFILAARPGVGKTSLAMNIAVHAATLPKEKRCAVAVFNLEMPSTQLVMRMLCSESRVSQGKLKSGRLSDYDMRLVLEHASRLFDAPIYVDDSSTLTIMELRSKARRLKQQDSSLGFIVIDYLQLMSSRGRTESRQLEIAEISRGLKSLSKELELPILALSQLSRDVEKGKRKPQLSDLRESGSIEQDADCVMFLHKEADIEPQGMGGPMPIELLIAKQRNGSTGSFEMTFMSEFTRFENKALQDDDEFHG